MLFIKQRNPRLNTPTDPIRAKLFKNISSSIVFLVFKHLYLSLFWLNNDVSLNVETSS